MLENEDRYDHNEEDIFEEKEIFVDNDEPAPQSEKQPESSVYSYSYIKKDEAPKQEEAPKYEEPKKQGQYSYIPHEPVRKQKKHMNQVAKTIACAILFGVIAGGLVLGSFAIGKNMKGSTTSAAAETTIASNDAKLSEAETPKAPGNSEEKGVYTVAQIAKQCSSSVVAITSMSVTDVQTMFGVYQQEQEGSGSGVIVAQTDKELLIATNNHVVQNSQQLTVCFMDSEDYVFTGQVKGTDPQNDLAVVSVRLSDLSEEVLNQISIATIGDSDALVVGDQVVAIGNALGLGQSVTSGVVSAKEREVQMDDYTANLLQTDAAINPGNSGGALFNMSGELVGINSAKYASEAVEGMGFAIPMSTAKEILENLMSRETRDRLTENYGCLNISGKDVSEEAVEYYKIPQGVYVAEVVKGAAAEKAGIKVGDIITGIDGITITSISQLKSELQYYKAGETIEVVLYRNMENGYEEQKVKVTLDNASEQLNNTQPQQGMQEAPSQSDPESDEDILRDFDSFFGR